MTFLAVAGVIVIMALAAVTVLMVRGHSGPPRDGRFAATPDACRTVLDSGAAAALPKAVADFRPQPDQDASPQNSPACYLVVQRDGGSPDQPSGEQFYLTVLFFVEKWETQDETAIAAKTTAELAKGFRPVPGVADQAFAKDGEMWLRISNLILNIRDAPVQDEPAVIEFARVLGRHLQPR
jgi:hypothetical protein